MENTDANSAILFTNCVYITLFCRLVFINECVGAWCIAFWARKCKSHSICVIRCNGICCRKLNATRQKQVANYETQICIYKWEKIEPRVYWRLDWIEELSNLSFVRIFACLFVHSIAIINTFGGRHETTTHEFLIRKRINCVYFITRCNWSRYTQTHNTSENSTKRCSK